VAEKALNRVFPATQRVTDAVKRMGNGSLSLEKMEAEGLQRLDEQQYLCLKEVKREAKICCRSICIDWQRR
jgi:hypothetical protein